MDEGNRTSISLIGLMTGLAVVLTTLIALDLNGSRSGPDLSADTQRTGQPENRGVPSVPGPAVLTSLSPMPEPDRSPAQGTPADLQGAVSAEAAPARAARTAARLGERYARVALLSRTNRDEEAMALLREIIDEHPSEIRAYAMLAELHYKNDNLAEAIPVWEQMLALDPLNAKARARLEKARREDRAHEGFTHEATRHFTIKFEGQENRHLYKTVMEIMEEAYGEIGKALSYYPDEGTIVFLYTQRQFFDVTRAPAWTGGIFDGKIRIPAGGYENHMERLRQVLFHEYTHAVIHQMTEPGLEKIRRESAPAVPTWLHEGVAQYLEPGARPQDAEDRLKALVRQGAFFRLPGLHGSFMGLNTVGAQVAYEESLSAVRFLVEEFGLYSLQQLLRSLGERNSMDEAVKDSLFISYKEFQSRWEETLRS